MTEIHAFDPDGTPSPGARRALDNAIANLGVPEGADGSRAAMIISSGDPIRFDLDAGTLTIPPATRVLVDSRNIPVAAAGGAPMVIPIPVDTSVYRVYFDTTKPSDPNAFVFSLAHGQAPSAATHVLLGAYSGWRDGSAYLHGGPYQTSETLAPIVIPDAVKSAQVVTFGGRFSVDWAAGVLNIPKSSHVFVDSRWIRLVGAAGTPLRVPLPAGTNIYRVYFDTTKPDTADAFVFRVYSADVSDLVADHVLIGVVARPNFYLGGVRVPSSEDPPLDVPDGSVTEEKLAPPVRNKLGQGGGPLVLSPVPAVGFKTPTIEGYSASLLDPTQPSDLYALLDAIPDPAEGAVSVRTLGHSQLANGEADLDLPILEYHYAVHRADATDVPVPRLLIQAGIHGYEKAAAYAAFQWLRDVLTGSSEMSVWVRRHIDIHLVPIANPYSFAHNRRHNVNDVDINTNFERGWVSRTKPDPYDPGSLWGGPAPMSEMETRVLDAWYAELAGEAIGMIDLHNTGVRTLSTGQHGLAWLISPDQRVRTIARQVIGEASRRWRADYPPLAALPPEAVFGDTNDRVDGTARNQAYVAYGIPPLTVDTSWAASTLAGAEKYGEVVMRWNVDTLGLAADGFVRNFQ